MITFCMDHKQYVTVSNHRIEAVQYIIFVRIVKLIIGLFSMTSPKLTISLLIFQLDFIGIF